MDPQGSWRRRGRGCDSELRCMAVQGAGRPRKQECRRCWSLSARRGKRGWTREEGEEEGRGGRVGASKRRRQLLSLPWLPPDARRRSRIDVATSHEQVTAQHTQRNQHDQRSNSLGARPHILSSARPARSTPVVRPQCAASAKAPALSLVHAHARSYTYR